MTENMKPGDTFRVTNADCVVLAVRNDPDGEWPDAATKLYKRIPEKAGRVLAFNKKDGKLVVMNMFIPGAQVVPFSPARHAGELDATVECGLCRRHGWDGPYSTGKIESDIKDAAVTCPVCEGEGTVVLTDKERLVRVEASVSRILSRLTGINE